MANKPLRSIKFPNLPDTYTVPVVDSTLAVSGAAADAKKTGDELAKKVNAVSGKGLSTNDFTTTEKNKLSGIESGANKTVIDSTLAVSGNAADAKAVGDALAVVDRNAYGAYIIPTASGPIAHFTDGADNIPMKDVLVHIEPVQEGSGDPSPDNVRPITGFTAAKVTRRGKNLLISTAPETVTKSGVTATKNDDGSITLNGTATDNNSFEVSGLSAQKRISIKANDTVTFSGCPSGGSNSTYRLVAYLYKNNTYTNTALIDTGNNYVRKADFDSLYCIISTYSGVTYDNLTFYPQLELGSTATAYEPYSGQTYDITFPSEAGTVYGGTLDVTSGVLTVDRAFKVFNGSENWVFSSTSVRPNIKITDIAYKGAVICNMYPYSPEPTAIEGTISTNGGVGYNIWIKDSINGDSLANWKTFLATNNLQVVYELATPITYQLTPQEITSLLGTNNLWADTGNSEVEYRADTKLYITKKITEAVSALS